MARFTFSEYYANILIEFLISSGLIIKRDCCSREGIVLAESRFGWYRDYAIAWHMASKHLRWVRQEQVMLWSSERLSEVEELSIVWRGDCEEWNLFVRDEVAGLVCESFQNLLIWIWIHFSESWLHSAWPLVRQQNGRWLSHRVCERERSHSGIRVVDKSDPPKLRSPSRRCKAFLSFEITFN